MIRVRVLVAHRHLITHFILAIVGFLVAMPILVAVITSIKPAGEVFTIPPKLIPSSVTLEHYSTAWNQVNFDRYLLNSIIIAAIVVTFEVTFAIMSAYAFSFISFPFKNTLFWIVLGSLMIPGTLVFIPNFVFVSKLGLANTYAGLTLPLIASSFGVFLLRQFFSTVPRELREAASLDGANHLRFLWSIVLPMSRGPIAALAIFSFLGAWNEYLWPLAITSDEQMRTVQIGIRYFLDETEGDSSWGALMAAAVVATGPTIAMFLIFRRRLLEGVSFTGVSR